MAYTVCLYILQRNICLSYENLRSFRLIYVQFFGTVKSKIRQWVQRIKKFVEK